MNMKKNKIELNLLETVKEPSAISSIRYANYNNFELSVNAPETEFVVFKNKVLRLSVSCYDNFPDWAKSSEIVCYNNVYLTVWLDKNYSEILMDINAEISIDTFKEQLVNKYLEVKKEVANNIREKRLANYDKSNLPLIADKLKDAGFNTELIGREKYVEGKNNSTLELVATKDSCRFEIFDQYRNAGRYRKEFTGGYSVNCNWTVFCHGKKIETVISKMQHEVDRRVAAKKQTDDRKNALNSLYLDLKSNYNVEYDYVHKFGSSISTVRIQLSKHTIHISKATDDGYYVSSVEGIVTADQLSEIVNILNSSK